MKTKMYSEKVLIDWTEYQRLKSYEKKYIALKKQVEREHQKVSEQIGRGSEQELERNILIQENENDNVPKPQKILEPITAPKMIEDVSLPTTSKESHEGGTEGTPDQSSQKKRKKQTEKLLFCHFDLIYSLQEI